MVKQWVDFNISELTKNRKSTDSPFSSVKVYFRTNNCSLHGDSFLHFKRECLVGLEPEVRRVLQMDSEDFPLLLTVSTLMVFVSNLNYLTVLSLRTIKFNERLHDIELFSFLRV